MENRNRQFKTALFDQFARIGKAISNPRRLEILDLLSQAPRTVELLARECGMTTANASQHLQLLKASRLVNASKSGLHVTYRLSDPDVWQFYHHLRKLAESRLTEVDYIMQDYLNGKKNMEPMSRSELLERVREGTVTVIDVRPEDEYRAGHITGAISAPLKDLEHRLSEIPPDKEIVAYCRGPFCVLAINAVGILREKGFRAVRFEEGINELRAEGFPITEGQEVER